MAPSVAITAPASDSSATSTAATQITAEESPSPSQSHRASKKSSGMSSAQRTNSNGPAYLAPPKILTEGGGYGYRGPGLIRESRRRRPWRKLLWVKQNYPDNYTDTSFLDSLQRNVNVRAYDFWPLVSDSTVIAQHLSSIVIFITAFVAISTEQIDPAIIAGGSTLFTIVGWLVWDEWTEMEEKMARFAIPIKKENTTDDASLNGRATPLLNGLSVSGNAASSSVQIKNQAKTNNARPRSCASSPNPKGRKPLSRQTSQLNLTIPSPPELLAPKPISATAATAASTLLSPNFSSSLPNAPSPITPTSPGLTSPGGYFPLPSPPPPVSRSHRRLSTLKSAILIYSTLLGLSPILKSLTEIAMKDSIWALSSWLFLVNLLCFDYGLSETEIGSGGEGTKKTDSSDKLNDPSLAGVHTAPGASTGTGANALSKKIPTSLSTTTAMAASVVLASRLPSTSSVFSLLLFSIQIFGLFPLFRRRLRYLSQPFHVLLTISLVLTAGLGLWMILGRHWAFMWFGLIGFGLGGAAWWLMGLQRYKNEIRGPWDPARPIFRRKQWME